ncbi:MAG: hypothetical protein A2X40_11250 [Elusimicrobia bacterium GWC2_65_9]|nr:MAG: hypothetical protein A2X37_01975 [Elusimicrobia bacterium GWA2_66_18]OGR77427.1 MAG: hypothetical protein A2X40_11250 [Elusimicrobia bacterium GWC2_65_9]
MFLGFGALAAQLNGCFLLVVGGAGAEAGYVATQDKRSSGETVSDQWIHAKIKSELIAASGVPSDRVDIKVRKGEATLKGVLDTAEQKAKVLNVARGVKGVRQVVDKLVVAK